MYTPRATKTSCFVSSLNKIVVLPIQYSCYLVCSFIRLFVPYTYVSIASCLLYSIPMVTSTFVRSFVISLILYMLSIKKSLICFLSDSNCIFLMTNAGLILAQRRRWCANNKPELIMLARSFVGSLIQ